MEVVIAPKARGDIANILAWTERSFGERIAKRYEALIAAAIERIAEIPDGLGSQRRPEIAENCRTYHLYFSRASAKRAAERIKRPRHVLVYRVRNDNTVEIGRVLHDSTDLDSNLPDGRAPPFSHARLVSIQA